MLRFETRLSLLVTASVVLLLAAAQLASSSSKLCCNPDCTQPISLARTKVRYLPKNKDFLSFPARASITILAKNVGDENLWEGKIFDHSGLVHKDNLEEVQVLCQNPQYWAKHGDQSQQGTDEGGVSSRQEGDEQPTEKSEEETGGRGENQVTQTPAGDQSVNDQRNVEATSEGHSSETVPSSWKPEAAGNEPVDDKSPPQVPQEEIVPHASASSSDKPETGDPEVPAVPGDWSSVMDMFKAGVDPSSIILPSMKIPEEVRQWRNLQQQDGGSLTHSQPSPSLSPESGWGWQVPGQQESSNQERVPDLQDLSNQGQVPDPDQSQPAQTTEFPRDSAPSPPSLVGDDSLPQANMDGFSSSFPSFTDTVSTPLSPASQENSQRSEQVPNIDREEDMEEEEEENDNEKEENFIGNIWKGDSDPNVAVPPDDDDDEEGGGVSQESATPLPPQDTTVQRPAEQHKEEKEELPFSHTQTAGEQDVNRQEQMNDGLDGNRQEESQTKDRGVEHEQEVTPTVISQVNELQSSPPEQQPDTWKDHPSPLSQAEQERAHPSPNVEERQNDQPSYKPVAEEAIPTPLSHPAQQSDQPPSSNTETHKLQHSITPGLEQYSIHEQQPVTEQPAPVETVTEQPPPVEPVTEQPVSNQPVTDQPVTEQPPPTPGLEQYSTQEQQPATEQLPPVEPVTEQPPPVELVSEQPVSNQPVTEQPPPVEPVTEQPVTEQPVTEQPPTITTEATGSSSSVEVQRPHVDEEGTTRQSEPPTPEAESLSEGQHESRLPFSPHMHYPGQGFSFEEKEMDCVCPVPFVFQLAASILPETMAEELIAIGPDVGIVAVLVTAIAIIIPLCLFCCRSRKSAAGKDKIVKKEKNARIAAEREVAKLKSEKFRHESDLQSITTQLNGCQEELEREKQGLWDLENIKLVLEEEKQNLSLSEASLKQECSQQQAAIHQLQGELTSTRSQLSTITDEQKHLYTQVQEMQQRRQELEAAKDQLEQDIYNAQQNLAQLQQQHGTLSEEHASLLASHQSLEEQQTRVLAENSELNQLLTEKENEIQTLQQCVKQLTEVAESEREEEEEEKAGAAEEGDQVCNSKLNRIQALLDTTKAQSDLRAMTEQRDSLQQQVQELSLSLDQLRAENQSLEDQVSGLHSDRELVAQQNQETQVKLKTLTEYFEQKELHLHKKLGAEEVVRQQVQSREALALERATAVEQEREKEREELRELRKQMTDIEKSLMKQVVTNEKRAEDALSQLRRTEQELRTSNREVTALRKRLADIEGRPLHPPSPPGARRPLLPDRRSPPAPRPYNGSSGGYGPRPPLGPPPSLGHTAPLSQPLRPRTSSPVDEVDTRASVSAHNETHPPLNSVNGPQNGLPRRPHSRGVVDDSQIRYPSDHTHMSRPPPPGMESRGDPYQHRAQDHPGPRPMGPLRSRYSPPRGHPVPAGPPPPMGRPRSSMSEHSMSQHEESFERSRHPQDRPPIPGNLEHVGAGPRPRMPPPPDYYGPHPAERRRSPSGPTYAEMDMHHAPQYANYPPSRGPPRGVGYPPRGMGYPAPLPRATGHPPPPPHGARYPPPPRDPRMLSSSVPSTGSLRPSVNQQPPPTHSLPVTAATNTAAPPNVSGGSTQLQNNTERV